MHLVMLGVLNEAVGGREHSAAKRSLLYVISLPEFPWNSPCNGLAVSFPVRVTLGNTVVFFDSLCSQCFEYLGECLSVCDPRTQREHKIPVIKAPLGTLSYFGVHRNIEMIDRETYWEAILG